MMKMQRWLFLSLVALVCLSCRVEVNPCLEILLDPYLEILLDDSTVIKNMTFSQMGGLETFKIRSNRSWTVKKSDDAAKWTEVSMISGGAQINDVDISFLAFENEEYLDRTSKFIFTTEDGYTTEVIINQQKKEVLEFSTTIGDKYDITSNAQEIHIVASTNIDDLKMETDSDWVILSGYTEGSSSVNHLFIKENLSDSLDREAMVTLSSKKAFVKQIILVRQCRQYQIKNNLSNFNGVYEDRLFALSGGRFDMRIPSNIINGMEVDIIASASQTWITQETILPTFLDTVKISISLQNSTTSSDSHEANIPVDNASANVASKGQSLVSSNPIAFKIQANPAGEQPREGIIILKNTRIDREILDTLIVRQDGTKAHITPMDSDFILSNEASVLKLDISSNLLAIDVEIPDQIDWITLKEISKTKALFAIAANRGESDDRIGILTFKGNDNNGEEVSREVTIKQQVSNYIKISCPEHENVRASGGVIDVKVVSNISDLDITTEGDNNIFTSIGKVKDGICKLNISANKSGSNQREAVVTFKGRKYGKEVIAQIPITQVTAVKTLVKQQVSDVDSKGNQDVEVKLTSNLDAKDIIYNISSSSQTMISNVRHYKYENGVHTYKLSVSANSSALNARDGVVTFLVEGGPTQSVIIHQGRADATIQLPISTPSVIATAKEVSFIFESNLSKEDLVVRVENRGGVNMVSGNTYVRITETPSLGVFACTFEISANATTQAREAEVSFTDNKGLGLNDKITVEQKQPSAPIAVGAVSVIPGNGGEFDINYTSMFSQNDIVAEVPSGEKIKYISKRRGQFTFYISGNPSGERSINVGKIVLRLKEHSDGEAVSIIQPPSTKRLDMAISGAITNVSPSMSTVKVNIGSNLTVRASSNNTNIVRLSKSSGVGEYTLTISANSSGSKSRKATVTFSGGGIAKRIEITQRNATPTIQVNSSNVIINSKILTHSIVVTSNLDAAHIRSSITNSANGVITRITSSTDKRTHTVTLTENVSTSSSRVGRVSIIGDNGINTPISKYVNITQTATAGRMSVNMTGSTNVSASGSSRITAVVATNLSLGDIVVDNRSGSMISVSSPVKGNGTYTYQLKMSNNTTVNRRVASIVFSSSKANYNQTFAVTQRGESPMLKVTHPDVVSKKGGEVTIIITSNLTDIYVQPYGNAYTISPKSSSGNSTYTVRISENKTGNRRILEIKFYSPSTGHSAYARLEQDGADICS